MLVVPRLVMADCEPTGLAAWPAAVLRVTPLSKIPIFPSCPQLPSVALSCPLSCRPVALWFFPIARRFLLKKNILLLFFLTGTKGNWEKP